MLFLPPPSPERTKLVQNSWDCHGTDKDDFLKCQHLCSPLNPYTYLLIVWIRVVSNLSFTATFYKHKPPVS